MTEKDKHIGDLLERFFDGKTSNAEERELYSFFHKEDIPEELQPYKPVFEYFENDIKSEPVRNTIPARIIKNNHRRKWLAIAAAAASVLALLLIKSLIMNRVDTFNPYEGSYIVKNREKIEDLKMIEAEDRAIQLKMDMKEKELAAITHLPEKKLQEYSEMDRKIENMINSGL
ncbi:MAG: hypothetical protein LBN74_00095 [Prevotella sp.]|jgi:hypothetical protein|nr:hypothetical protein [Prevotella sp.]